MTTHSSDPLALVDLLWSPSTRIGRSGATIESIVRAATALADDGGLGAVSMRQVARRVGVAPMTLYGYVPGRDELLELMLDQVVGATHPEPPAVPGDWRTGAQRLARGVFETGLRHRWIGDITPARPVLGPGVCRCYESELEVFEGIGLSDLEMDRAVTVVRGMAEHAARWQVGLDDVRARSGQTDEQWWERVGPRLAAAMAGESLPLSTRVGASVSSAGEPWAAVEQGVTMFLDGMSARLDSLG